MVCIYSLNIFPHLAAGTKWNPWIEFNLIFQIILHHLETSDSFATQVNHYFLFLFISKFTCSPILSTAIHLSLPLPTNTHPSGSSYLRVTLDDGKQRLMNSQERRLVDEWGQAVEGHRLERSKGQDHMMRVGDKPLPLAQQWCQWHHRRNGKGEGQRGVLTGWSY